MASLQKSAITNAGRHLISKGIAGTEIKFTRLAIGSGYLPTGHIPEEQTALVQPVLNVSIIKLKVLGGGQVVVGGKFSNAGITTGFFYREIGLFALDPDAGEILYSYGNADNLAEWIDPAGTKSVISKSVDVRTSVENANSITAVIRPESDISIEMFEEHTKNQQNPHSITAEQSGALPKDGKAKDSEKLGGKAPDQFLSSTGTAKNAEKLGGQLPGYYAKNSGLTSHSENKLNPHEVTATQAGALPEDAAAKDSEKLGGNDPKYYATGTAVTKAQTTANSAMPKSGGTFTGPTYGYWADHGSGAYVVRGIAVQTAAGVNINTAGLLFRRK